MHRIRREVQYIWSELKKDSGSPRVWNAAAAARANAYNCPRCPFRAFARKGRPLAHCRKFHAKVEVGATMQIASKLAREMPHGENARIGIFAWVYKCNILKRSCGEIAESVGPQPPDIAQKLAATSAAAGTRPSFSPVSEGRNTFGNHS